MTLAQPIKLCRGEVAEWLKAHAWNACIRETVSRVRIPLSPPFSNRALKRTRRLIKLSLLVLKAGLVQRADDNREMI